MSFCSSTAFGEVYVTSSSISPFTLSVKLTLIFGSIGSENIGGVFKIPIISKLNFNFPNLPEEVFAATKNENVLTFEKLIYKFVPCKVTREASSTLSTELEYDSKV